MAEAKHREGADIYEGEVALEKAASLLEDSGLPGGLLPLKNVIEAGHVKETGYVWIRQEEEIEHVFKQVGRPVKYGTEIKAFIEKGRLRDLSGVKSKEMLLWVPINDISVPSTAPNKVAFRSIGGLGKMFKKEAFERGQ
ncbi:hypothetical protein R1flu_019112 [Riccia fluitans]|uniref:DUF538 domain-containing protein n=1 Tax=Riccia fluitans TaxID=41844 RepID=A0ABD1ZHR7_9MARC